MNQSLSYEIAAVMPAALATGLFISLCTLSAPSNATTTNGSPVLPPVPVTGLINIPCMDAVPGDSRIQATEVRELKDILSKGFRHVMLNGYYPQIIYTGVGAGWWATVDGIDYELLGAEPDSQGTQTRLHLGLITI